MHDDGPGGPILLVVPDRGGFGRYVAEILRAEGVGAFRVVPLGRMTSAVLDDHQVIILAVSSVDAQACARLERRVAAGAGLIALHPDPRLGPLLGVEIRPGPRGGAYLAVRPPLGGDGITDRPMQIHADTAVLHAVQATEVAGLLDGDRQPTGRSGVTVWPGRDGRGTVVAFAYDLARSIVGTRQGNPAWAGQNRDGDLTVRSNDLFYGDAVADPAPDWVDPDLLDLPQADEQQRLLVHLLHRANPGPPVGQLWYLPDGGRAAVVLTGDDHGGMGTVARFDELAGLDVGPEGDGGWRRVTATSYTVPDTELTDEQAARLEALGFEISLHATLHENRFTAASLHRDLGRDLRAFRARFPSVPAPVTHRTHSVPWSDWSSQAEVERAHGIRLDANYYCYPAPWVRDRPSLFTGSGLPMRFARASGEVIDCYQLVTQLTDEAKQTYPATIDTLLDRALGPAGHVVVLGANMHTDLPGSNGSDAIVAAAHRRGVAVTSARRLLSWLDAREASTIRCGTAHPDGLDAEVQLDPGAAGLIALVPLLDRHATSVTLDGRAIDHWHLRHGGTTYVAFRAETGAVRIAAAEGGPGEVADVTAPAAIAPEPADLVHSQQADFLDGTCEGTAVSGATGGSIVLAPRGSLEVPADGDLPRGWHLTTGEAGAVHAAGGWVRLEGAELAAGEEVEPGTTFEAEAVLLGAPGEAIGFAGAQGTIVGFVGAGEEAVGFVAGPGRSVALPGSWAGEPHRYKVLWQPGLVAAFIDGWPVAEHRTAIAGPLRPTLRAAALGGPLAARWGRVSPFPSSGTYTSAVIDAGGDVWWGRATIVAVAESMTAARLSVRTGPTPQPDEAWTPFCDPGPLGLPLGHRARYAQYRLHLTSCWHVTPEVQAVVLERRGVD